MFVIQGSLPVAQQLFDGFDPMETAAPQHWKRVGGGGGGGEGGGGGGGEDDDLDDAMLQMALALSTQES